VRESSSYNDRNMALLVQPPYFFLKEFKMHYWIPVDDLYDAFDCDICDAMVSKPYKYCPKCGTEYAGINMLDGTLISLEKYYESKNKLS